MPGIIIGIGETTVNKIGKLVLHVKGTLGVIVNK